MRNRQTWTNPSSFLRANGIRISQERRHHHRRRSVHPRLLAAVLLLLPLPRCPPRRQIANCPSRRHAELPRLRPTSGPWSSSLPLAPQARPPAVRGCPSQGQGYRPRCPAAPRRRCSCASPHRRGCRNQNEELAWGGGRRRRCSGGGGGCWAVGGAMAKRAAQAAHGREERKQQRLNIRE